MSFNGRRDLWLLLLLLVELSHYVSQAHDTYDKEDYCWKKVKKESTRTCVGENYRNVPILNGVYCFNDGTGNCKAFAGRFEFEFNTFTDTIKGAIAQSRYVDQFGYHERVPVAYNIKGEIIYADRSINWARKFKQLLKDTPKNLLSAFDINWCQYVLSDWWPYKSAILDPTKRFQIYFFNRQSCIYDTQAKDKSKAFQHFNTRFMHNSSLRIDLDMNPLIFVMEDDKVDNGTDRLRLVKNKRQHWYEVQFKVIQPGEGIRYFVDMDVSETLPSKINPDDSVLIPEKAYTNSKYCIEPNTRDNGKNNRFFDPECGVDQQETVDIPKPLYKVIDGKDSIWINVNLHNIPREPWKTSEHFYGLDISSSEHWSVWAQDGYVFTATTTIPTSDPLTVEVVSLFSEFKKGGAPKSDENYPTPYLARYKSTMKEPDRPKYTDWEFDKTRPTKRELKNLNYVDDIAYLPKCKTILVIYGPLYSEFPANKFDLDTKAPIDSIYELGIWEMVNAFFAMPDENDQTIWVFHRTNFITPVKYQCGSGGGLVTATKDQGGKYYYTQNSLNLPPFLYTILHNDTQDYSEEVFFKDQGVFFGSMNELPISAPDPNKYPIGNEEIEKPMEEKESSWIWWLIGVALLLIVAMCLICMFTLRRRRVRTQMDALTARSSNLPGSGISRAHSVRSSLQSTSRGSSLNKPTARSILQSTRPNSAVSARTIRSRMPSQSSGQVSPSGASKFSSRARSSSMNNGPRSSRASQSSKKGKSSKKSRSLKHSRSSPNSRSSTSRTSRPGVSKRSAMI